MRILVRKSQIIVNVVSVYNDPWVQDHVPCLYQITLADQSGAGPTAKEWKIIRNHIDIYRDSRTTDDKRIKIAYAIDKVGHPMQEYQKTKQGVRRYMPPHHDPDQPRPGAFAPANIRYQHLLPSVAKMETLQDFTAAIRSRANAAREQDTLAVTYGGYTMKASERWDKHDKNTSNYPMGLCNAICQVFFRARIFSLKNTSSAL
jgi:hypothetical protein